MTCESHILALLYLNTDIVEHYRLVVLCERTDVLNIWVICKLCIFKTNASKAFSVELIYLVKHERLNSLVLKLFYLHKALGACGHGIKLRQIARDICKG